MRACRHVFVLVIAALTPPACAPPTGSERGACYPNATCDPGLRCLSDRCVRFESDGGVLDSARADADVSSDSPIASDDAPSVDPTFTRDMVPFFDRMCGTDTSSCHSRAVYNANRDFGCRGWLALENIPLGATLNSGAQAGQPTGCPDRSLYDRLVGEACQQCSGTNPRLVVPGDPNNSYLFRKINGGPYCRTPITNMPTSAMPLVGVLTTAEIERVRVWIANGAPQ